MTTRRHAVRPGSWFAAAAAVATTAVLAAATAVATAPTLGERGVGGLVLGRPLAALRAEGLVVPTPPGCELASPRPLVARLRPPFSGWATFGGAPRHRLEALAVTAGAATSRGIAVGARGSDVARAYPGATKI